MRAVLQLFTLGYEGCALEDFLATLQLAGVEYLIDIRDVPVSRRKGFSKTPLSLAVRAIGIQYVHLSGLGDPKEGRLAAKSGDTKRFREIFAGHLKTDGAVADLQRAIEIAGVGASCLLCYERDYLHCHRSLVAAAMAELAGFQVKNLGVPTGAAFRLQAERSQHAPRTGTNG